jgi:hypothetical protein
MPLAEPPSAWQRQLGAQIQAALRRVPASPAAPFPEDDSTLEPELTGWRSALTWRDDIDRWAARLAPSREQQTLYARCLRHYPHYFDRPLPAHDDAGVAVAGWLVASVQALESHAATPLRWRAVARWLDSAVLLPEATAGEPLPWVPLCARMSLLTVAIGEWSQQASVQGPLARRSARLMACQHLEQEFGLDAELLLNALRHLQIIPAQGLPVPDAALPN